MVDLRRPFALPQTPYWRTLAWSAFFLAGAAIAALTAASILGARAQADVLRDGGSEAAFRAAMLSRHLQQFRDVPMVLAQDPDVQSATTVSPDSAQARALSAKLERLTRQTEAQAIYLLGPDGVTRAASNWREARSFVGQDYAFRPYFTEAVKIGSYEFFALGTVSAESGLYIAQRVQTDGGGAGVVVVKVHMDEVENEWAQSPGRVAVTDPRGIVVLSSVADWRFRTTRALSAAELADVRASRQFGDSPALALLSLARSFDPQTSEIAIEHAIEGSPWRLSFLASTKPVADAQRTGLAVGALSGALFAGVVFVVRNARRRAKAERDAEEAARHTLEQRVQERTTDLNSANARLNAEIGERRRAEANAQLLQDELIQANRLAILGQISAGVAHEINQPLAAIRAFSENAATFLDRAEPHEARANLTAITDLATRIATITDELRSMARKSNAPRERVEIAAVVDGALLLVGARLRASDTRLEYERSDQALVVSAHRMRLEQVLINLLQNALDACAGVAAPKIKITCEHVKDQVLIDVDDNGPGLSVEAAEALFQPFNTTKAQGLGLGLVISKEICQEYGGRLERIDSALGGAAFRMTLPAIEA